MVCQASSFYYILSNTFVLTTRGVPVRSPYLRVLQLDAGIFAFTCDIRPRSQDFCGAILGAIFTDKNKTVAVVPA